MSSTFLLSELGYRVKFDIGTHHVDFSVFPEHPDENDDKTVPQIRGFVKWDQCSNWEFPASKDCMYHFCERERIESFGRVMLFCFDYAKKNLPTWCDYGES